MPGVQPFTTFTMGRETTAGTPVATTRMWYPDGTGIVDIDSMLKAQGGNRGARTNISHHTSTGIAVGIPFRSHSDVGLGWDELPVVLNQAGGGTAGSGASANKTWTWAPSQTAANTIRSHTIETGDDIQFWEYEYARATSFTISGGVNDLTQFEVNWIARQPTKTTKTAVAANTALRIPSALWVPSFAHAQSALGTATAVTDLLTDWSLTVQTGAAPLRTLSGALYYTSVEESLPLSADLTFHVVSNAQAITQFYDKWNPGGTPVLDFMQLKAIGPTLGTGTYMAAIQMALNYTNVKPIGSEVDGVNLHEVTARIVLDPTWAQSIGGTVVCTISDIP